MRPRVLLLAGLVIAVGGLSAQPACGQEDYGTRLGLQRGPEASFAPQGPGVLLAVMDPAVRKWYVPQELFTDYRWRQWEYTNYAREHYQRYVDISLEGDTFYDLYGNQVTRGWLIYNNAQTRPLQFGNTLFKSDKFSQWFSGVVVAADAGGQYSFALTLSNRLRTVLTPMVFSKPRWDGVQFDFAADRYEGTLIYSRISSPGGLTTRDLESRHTNSTALFGGRLTAHVTDFVELGVHMVNAHQSNTLTDKLAGNPFSGLMTVQQNRTISLVEVALRDDSPEDGVGGAAYFPADSDIIITYRDGSVQRGKDFQFKPIIEGGFEEEGFIAANGTEEIRLLYDFDSPSFVDAAGEFQKEDIVKVEFELVLANDYQVWMTSNRQTNKDERSVLLLVTQAKGNVKDVTNLRTVRFAYGLPTATNLLGASIEVRDARGFDLYGEYDRSWSYRKYPNAANETHKTSSGIAGQRSAPAWMINVSKKNHPWFVFGEVFHMDPAYNTSTFVTSSTGNIDYESAREGRVELVDDNDDHDSRPDNIRYDWRAGDLRVFPGWDQNGDFVPDINQNDNVVSSNAVPDHDEPFLRFHADRPEFLFGMDMNNNFWVDQYENDEEPDYPYKRDHEGFNLYGGAELTPELRLTVGVLRQALISGHEENRASYAMVSMTKDLPQLGRVRMFEMTKLVEDDIADPLLQWAPDNTLTGGDLTRVEDPLLARETWVNQIFLGHNLQGRSLHIQSKLNWVLYHQLMKKSRREEFGLDASDYFFGIVNKASYRYQLGRWTVEPRWKSEYRRQTRGLFALDTRESLMELFSGLAETPVLRSSRLQAGIEYALFNDFDVKENDFDSATVALQLSNRSHYVGYEINALAGVALERTDFKETEARTTFRSFITIYAGL